MDNPSLPDALVGEYFASHDAIISYINLTSGQMVVKYNDVVKKGDLLATSNLQYLDNLYSSDKLVPLEGLILGNIKEYYDIEVLKKEEIAVFTGKMLSSYYLNFKNKKLFLKANPFLLSYEKTYPLTLNKLNFIYYKNYYEKRYETIIRNFEDAKDYALIKLYQDYEAVRVSEKEKIISIILASYQEYDDKFSFHFLVTACKNIAIFKSF